MKFARLITCLLMFLTMISDVGFAQTGAEKEQIINSFEKALDALDFTVAIDIITPLAEAGDIDAQYHLGQAHKWNHFYLMNKDTAKWFELAAEQGHPQAAYDLIRWYRFDVEDEDSDEKADYWTLKSIELQTALANAGDAEAQYKLGEIYSALSWEGRDYDIGVQWYTKAAEQNHVNALYELAEAYEIGVGVEQNSAAIAVNLYTQAERAGHARAAEKRNDLIQKVQGWMALAQTSFQAQDFKTAFDNYLNAATYNVPDALYAVGILYFHGNGTEKNLDNAMLYLQKAAAQNHPSAMLDLGKIYMGNDDFDTASKIFYGLADAFQRTGNRKDFEAVLGLLDQLAKEKNHAKSKEMFEELRRR